MNDSLAPVYPHTRIAKLDSLEKALGVSVTQLQYVAQNRSSFYHKNPANEKGRITYSVSGELKNIQKKIKLIFLDKVIFPKYLHAYIKNKSPFTNAKAHLNQKQLINHDILKFFDNCSELAIYRVWKLFFNFSEEVAKLLTQLTIFSEKLAQGACTSPGLSNLIFWKDEPKLVRKLAKKNLVYTRYGDDITVSSSYKLDDETLTSIHSDVLKMMLENGFESNRKKQKISSSSTRMLVNGQIVNRKIATLGKNTDGKHYLKNVRAEIHCFSEVYNTLSSIERHKKCQTVIGKINYIKRYQPNKAKKLKDQLDKVCANFENRRENRHDT